VSLTEEASSLYLVFDCESVGLHGETFAVGWVLIDADGTELECGGFQCPEDASSGTKEGHQWVKANVPTLPFAATSDPIALRTEFWLVWQEAKKRGALLVTDCGWPVEARFLAACVDDSPGSREWDGPYPLIDVSSMLLAYGLNPINTFGRLESEQPEHNPVCDARQSARIFIETLRRIQGTPP
jgi:hypothetical protein